MKVFNSSQSWVDEFSDPIRPLGMVSTMGALHQGHMTLIERALKENNTVLVTIFINPTQFNDKTDLERYPQDLDADIKKIEQFRGNIFVYTPAVEDVYGNNITAKSFNLGGLDEPMEGVKRKNHFHGVATVVSYFLETFQPNRAYFGEKDFQQLRVIEQLSKALALNTKIIGCPIIREPDGLAMSSRNQLLGVEDRKKAPMIFQLLQLLKAQSALLSYRALREIVHDFFKKNDSLKLDYFVICDPKTLHEIDFKQSPVTGRAFIAVYLGKIRLIDNLDMS